MLRLAPIKAYRLIRILVQLGFEEIRQKGSHKFFGHPDGRSTVVAFHANEEVDSKLLNRILKNQVKISREEFQRLL
jgi:predicted RNA binding protein YcfA (HicA-like mRNA interferase family)